jgi:hypothetical protein
MVTARPALGLDTGVSFDRSAVVLLFRLPGIKRLNPDHDGAWARATAIAAAALASKRQARPWALAARAVRIFPR